MCSQGARYPIHWISIQQHRTAIVYALAFITLFQVKPTVAVSDVCYYDEEDEVIFEDELYATSQASSSAWLTLPGIAIFLFLVAAILVFSYCSSWFVRSYMEGCCDKCWSCGKGFPDNDSTVDLPVYKDKKDKKKDEKQDSKKAKEYESEKAKGSKIDIEREGSTATENGDGWESKVNEFLRDMPDGSSVNHLYTEDARARKTSASSCNGHVLNVEEIHTDTESPKTPTKVIKVRDEAQLNGVQSTSDTRVIVDKKGAKNASNGTVSQSNNRPGTAQRVGTVATRPTTAQRTGVQTNRPTTAQRTSTGTQSNRPTTAQRTGTQPTRPTTAQRTGTQPTRPTTAQRTGTQPVRPTTAQRTGTQTNRPTTAQKTANKVSPEPRPTTRQGARPLTAGSGISTPVTPTSARRREEKKKFDRAWNSVQTIQPLSLDDDDHLQIVKPEPPKPLVGLRRPSVIQQQFRTTGRISKSIRRDSAQVPNDSQTSNAEQR